MAEELPSFQRKIAAPIHPAPSTGSMKGTPFLRCCLFADVRTRIVFDAGNIRWPADISSPVSGKSCAESAVMNPRVGGGDAREAQASTICRRLRTQMTYERSILDGDGMHPVNVPGKQCAGDR